MKALIKKSFSKWDVFFLTGILALLNIHLISGAFPYHLIASTQAIDNFKALNLLLYPFIHLSWYHLILDAFAFISLYQALDNYSSLKRIATFLLCSFFSLLFSKYFSADFLAYGLCGLSGIAHGFMVLYGCEIAETTDKKLGAFIVLGVFLKSIVETLTGSAVFAFLHLNQVGTPISMAHLGGAFGGLMAFMIFKTAYLCKETNFKLSYLKT